MVLERGSPLIPSKFCARSCDLLNAYTPGGEGGGGVPFFSLILHILSALGLEKTVLNRTFAHFPLQKEAATRLGTAAVLFLLA